MALKPWVRFKTTIFYICLTKNANNLKFMTFCHFEWNFFMWTSLLKCKYLVIIAGMPKSAVMMMTTRRQWWRWLFQYWTSSRENRNQSGMLAAPAVNWSLYWKGCQSSIRRGEANVSRCWKGLIKIKIYLCQLSKSL